MSGKVRFVSTAYKNDRDRRVEYRVIGFWSESTIRVDLRKSCASDEWRPVEISRSMGGRDGTLSNIEAESNFAAALMDAIREAKKLQKWADKQNAKMEAK